MMRVYPDRVRREVLEAVRKSPWSLNAIAKAYGIGSVTTIARWARAEGIPVPDARERMLLGGPEGARRRWGDYRRRRRRARALRQQGLPLAEIAERVGYRSTAAVSYAVRADEDGENGQQNTG
jgi:AraC-like DNA-binding protein